MLLKLSILLSLVSTLTPIPITVNGVRDTSALLPFKRNTPLTVQLTLPAASYTLDIIKQVEQSCRKTTSVVHSVSLTQLPDDNLFSATVPPEVLQGVMQFAAQFVATYYLSLRQTVNNFEDFIQQWQVALEPYAKEDAWNINCFTSQSVTTNFFGSTLEANNNYISLTEQLLEYVPIIYFEVKSPLNSGELGCEAYTNVRFVHSWLTTFNDLHEDCRGLCETPAKVTNTHFNEVNDYFHQSSALYEIDLLKAKSVSKKTLNYYELYLYLHMFLYSDTGDGYAIFPLTIRFYESFIFSKYRFTNVCKELSPDTCSFPTQLIKCNNHVQYDTNVQLTRIPDLQQCGLNLNLLIDPKNKVFNWAKTTEVTEEAALFNQLQSGFSNSYIRSSSGKELKIPLMADNAYYWMLNGDFFEFFQYRRVGAITKAKLCTTLDNCKNPWCSDIEIPGILKYPDFPTCGTMNRFVMKQHHQVILYPEEVSTREDLQIQFNDITSCSLQNPKLVDVIVSPYSNINSDHIQYDQYDDQSCIQTLLECRIIESMSSVASLYRCQSYDGIEFNFCEVIETEDNQIFKCVKNEECYLGIPKIPEFLALKQNRQYRECSSKFCLFPSRQDHYNIPQIRLDKRCEKIAYLNCAALKTQLQSLLEPFEFKFQPKQYTNEQLIAKYLRQHSSFSDGKVTLTNLDELSCQDCTLYMHEFQVERRDQAQEIFYKLSELRFQLKTPPQDVILTLEAPTIIGLDEALDLKLFIKAKKMDVTSKLSIVEYGKQESYLGSSQVYMSSVQKFKHVVYGAHFDTVLLRAQAIWENREVIGLSEQPLVIKLNSNPSVLICGELELTFKLEDGTAVIPSSLGYVELREESTTLSIQAEINQGNCEPNSKILQIFVRAHHDLNQQDAQNRGLAKPAIQHCGYLPLHCERGVCHSLDGIHFNHCSELEDADGRVFTRCDYSDMHKIKKCILSWDQRALFEQDMLRAERIHPLHSEYCKLGSDLQNCPLTEDCMMKLRAKDYLDEDCEIGKTFTQIQTHPPGLYLEFQESELQKLSKKLKQIDTVLGSRIILPQDLWQAGVQQFWVHVIASQGSRPLYLRKKVVVAKLEGRQESNPAVPTISNYKFGFTFFRQFDEIQTEILISLLGVQPQYTEQY